MASYRRMNICIDSDGYMWTKEIEDLKNPENDVQVNMTINTLKSFLRNDYKTFCEKSGYHFVNIEFEHLLAKTLHEVFHTTRKSYTQLDIAKKAGIFKEIYTTDSRKL